MPWTGCATTFRWKADGLDPAGLSTTIGASTLTLGGLLKHLASVEDYYFTVKMRGEPIGEPWEPRVGTAATTGSSSPPPTTPPPSSTRCTTAPSGAPARGWAPPWRTAGSTSRSTPPTARANHASLRRLVCDLIEEYGRHTGHADLLREAVDGVVGEDPPAGWRPADLSSRPHVPGARPDDSGRMSNQPRYTSDVEAYPRPPHEGLPGPSRRRTAVQVALIARRRPGRVRSRGGQWLRSPLRLQPDGRRVGLLRRRGPGRGATAATTSATPRTSRCPRASSGIRSATARCPTTATRTGGCPSSAR